MTHGLSRRAVLSVTVISIGSAAMGPGASAASEPTFFRRTSLPIGLELYTVAAELKADFDATLARIAQIGFKRIELSGYHGRTAAELRAAFDRHGLECRSMLVQAEPTSYADGPTLADVSKLVSDAKTIGVEDVILAMAPPPPGFVLGEKGMQGFIQAMQSLTLDQWKSCAALLNNKGKLLADAGLRLGYHNHNIEFAPVGGQTPYEILMTATDPAFVTFELDVGWVVAAGLDPIALINRHRGRFQLMHVKDLKSSTKANFAISMDPADVGAGVVDWSKVLPAAYEAGVRKFLIEQEPPFPPAGAFVSAENGYRYLTQLKA